MSNKDLVVLSSGVSVCVPRKRPSEKNDVSVETRPAIEKVNNVWGSTAGAGSDFFHIYRKHRAREMERLKGLDEAYEREQEDKEFQERRLALAQVTAARSQKSAMKRKKMKVRQQQLKALNKQAAKGNCFKNDGSFLSQIIAESNIIDSTNSNDKTMLE